MPGALGVQSAEGFGPVEINLVSFRKHAKSRKVRMRIPTLQRVERPSNFSDLKLASPTGGRLDSDLESKGQGMRNTAVLRSKES